MNLIILAHGVNNHIDDKVNVFVKYIVLGMVGVVVFNLCVGLKININLYEST